jgi:hypothetical protein
MTTTTKKRAPFSFQDEVRALFARSDLNCLRSRLHNSPSNLEMNHMLLCQSPEFVPQWRDQLDFPMPHAD